MPEDPGQHVHGFAQALRVGLVVIEFGQLVGHKLLETDHLVHAVAGIKAQGAGQRVAAAAQADQLDEL